MTDEIDVRLNEQQIDIIRNIETAGHFRDMVHSQGWKLFRELMDKRIEQLKEQFLSTAMDKDALWASQIRLQGIREFANALLSQVDQAVEALNPEALRGVLRGLDPTEFDGEIGLKDLP